MYKIIICLFSLLCGNAIAGNYDYEIKQAMQECKVERNMYHGSGSACERARQLIDLQKSENDQNSNININR